MTIISDILETRARLILISLGLLLIVLGNAFDYRLLKIDIGELLAHIGALLLIVGLLHWIFEASMRRELMREIFETVVGAGQVSTSGLVDVRHNSRDVDYRSMITAAKHLTIGEHYSSRFFEDYAPQIRDRLCRHCETTAVLLKHNCSAAEYLKSSGSGHGGIESNLEKIRDALADAGTETASLRVKWHDRVLRYSFVMSEDAIWIRFFTNSEGFSLVPALRIKKATPLYEFFLTDITRLLEHAEDGAI